MSPSRPVLASPFETTLPKSPSGYIWPKWTIIDSHRRLAGWFARVPARSSVPRLRHRTTNPCCSVGCACRLSRLWRQFFCWWRSQITQDPVFPDNHFCLLVSKSIKRSTDERTSEHCEITLMPSKRCEMVCLQSQQTSWLLSTAQKEEREMIHLKTT
jgi:hypothetical protein